MSEKNTIYEKLSPQRKKIIDEVLSNLEKNIGLWSKNWKGGDAPESAISGKKYRGMNNFFLILIANERNYTDNRWITFHQMKEKGWNFKTDEEGKSIAKGKGVPIEYFEFHDLLTKKPFTKASLIDLSEEEKEEYWKDNVKILHKQYVVFNGDLIEGIPQKERKLINEKEKEERAEKLIDYWSKNIVPIFYDRQNAYYNPQKDEIHLPKVENFYSMQDYYSTVLHEMGHSTGHKERLNRNLDGKFGSDDYAEEELRAEIASMFLEQELNIHTEKKDIKNNSAYIKHWYSQIKDNPNVLFHAIAEAEKITQYILDKEKEFQLDSLPEEKSDIYKLPSECFKEKMANLTQKNHTLSKSRKQNKFNFSSKSK